MSSELVKADPLDLNDSITDTPKQYMWIKTATN